MKFKIVTSAFFAASVAIIPAERVEADAGDFIAGAIIGGIVGANAKKQRRTTRSTRSTRSTTRKKRSTRSSLPSTQEGRNIQASLNYFGFNAGAVDGQLGRKTKNAVSQYQAYLGYPVTGQLSEFEKNLLVSSYNRAQAGGYAVQQQVAANVDGTRGLLKTYRAEMAGTVPAPAAPATTIVVAPQPQPVQPAIGTTTTVAATLGGASALAAAVAPANTNGALPNFLGAGTQASLASHCNTVSLITNTNGGFVKLASMTDPNVALNEQFCLARTYAIAKSEELTSKIQGFTPDQIAAQCQGFGPAMKDKVASLSIKQRDAVAADVSNFALNSGMSPAQLQGTAKICLGVGYRTDNMDVAVGSALILYALGEGVYGELMGHHLSQGFGPAKSVEMAPSWYQAGLQAADSGAAAVFVPGQPERTELIRQASQRMGGSAGIATQPLVQPASGSALPTFTISE